MKADRIIEQLKAVPKLRRQQHYDCLKLGLRPAPEVLKQLIKLRLLKRLKQGMLKEVKTLHLQGLSWVRLESFGLEYKYCALYLQNKITKRQLLEQIQRACWRLVRQQLNWFERDQEIIWLQNKNQAVGLVKGFLAKTR